MYAVIFKAKMKNSDQEYLDTAKRLRELAFNKYGCIDFVSVCEEGQEVSISYWKDKQSIQAWKEDKEHLQAQKKGQEKWYESYHVEIVEVLHEYGL